MAGSTFKMLDQMRAPHTASSLNSRSKSDELADFLGAPQLRPSPNMGNKLEEILNSSLSKNYSPMNKA